jgi:hypothetical protein
MKWMPTLADLPTYARKCSAAHRHLAGTAYQENVIGGSNDYQGNIKAFAEAELCQVESRMPWFNPLSMESGNVLPPKHLTRIQTFNQQDDIETKRNGLIAELKQQLQQQILFLNPQPPTPISANACSMTVSVK